MAKIAFVTDSTAYIPTDLVRKYNITVTPQILVWGEETFRDGVDIQPDEFYARLKTTKVMPTTSQVSVVTMQSTFQKLIEEGNQVMGVFLSGKLSGTMQSAIQGREALGKAAEKITILDSNTTAMAMGFMVLLAARAAEQGASVAECVKILEKARELTGVFFVVDTLEFLHRGGRIGGAQRFIGSALNLKPILTLRDGRVEPDDRVRTKSKAIDRMLELGIQQAQGKKPVHVATLHANAEQEAKDLLERAKQALDPVESVLSTVSPVVGVHAGPGTVGLVYLAGL